ncbi:MAG: helix-turn-helix domain-containing protein [Saprospiraceae bacterium]|nr:helix-turn-helix domain-containing protein [Saprospiraceae bacterium]
MAKTQSERIIFGLKIRQLRQELGWNFEELSKQSGISISYLNEIEKGKKYPQPENQQRLATALNVSTEFLATPELTKQFAPIGDLLKTNFLNEIPLDLFGIEVQQVIEIIARAPDRVNAFISALLEIARNYSFRDENFFFAALRAYQELRVNYFEEIEDAADEFVRLHQLPDNGGVPEAQLASILELAYGYKIDDKSLSKYPELQSLRAVYNPHKKRLLLNDRLNERQRAFQLAKECGFNALQLKERPLASNMLRINNFEEVLNNYQAAYFAVAILINRNAFVRDIQVFFSLKTWDAQFLIDLMAKYQASPEVLFQRFNLLTKYFKLDKVFFMRIIHDTERDGFDIDKELHLNRKHQPHATGLNEHYCRRWLSVKLLRQLQAHNPTQTNAVSGVQRARFVDSGEQYLVISIAKQGYPTVGRNVGVMLGVLLDEQAQRSIAFWDDPNIESMDINVTCERCSIQHCAERAAPPTVIQKREDRKRMQALIQKFTEK